MRYLMAMIVSLFVAVSFASAQARTPTEDDYYKLCRYNLPEGEVLEAGTVTGVRAVLERSVEEDVRTGLPLRRAVRELVVGADEWLVREQRHQLVVVGSRRRQGGDVDTQVTQWHPRRIHTP